LATFARYQLRVPGRTVLGLFGLSAVMALAVAVAGTLTGLHRGRFIVGSSEELVALVRLYAIVTGVATVISLLFGPRLVPLSASLGSFAPAFALGSLPRIALGLSTERAMAPDPSTARRVIVFGAGDAAAQIVRALLRDRESQLLPVALVDDDPDKANRTIAGVEVMGTRDSIPRLARTLRADVLLVATPSASPEVKQAIASAGLEAGLDLRILPPLGELVDNAVGTSDIRTVTEADLLGRPQVEIDLDAVANLVTGRRVLVTGAGGSIGSEICRQLKAFGPAELIMLDRDESALHAVQLTLEGRALLEDSNLVVADIRDAQRVCEIVAGTRPHVIFHAAALKHLPLLEMHPDEGVKTNVWGTDNLLRAALDFDVETFVNISTDKAADPRSVLGQTKSIAERLTADAAATSNRAFVSVRFGNVLGSRGSVLPTFRAQIDAGGPVTVTHPDVTRFFMTTEEAVRLVFQAATIGEPGEVLVLDMGAPVRIDDVARRLIAQSGRRIAIVYTGLRPGEKLHEQLVGSDEVAATRTHPLVMHTRVPPLSSDHLVGLSTAEVLSIDAPNLFRVATVAAPERTTI
jgi:FlaA1/EpsC-like NDP-sugar epimerase